MSIHPLDRLHDQQPVPGQDQNPSQAPDPDVINDNPDVQPGNRPPRHRARRARPR